MFWVLDDALDLGTHIFQRIQIEVCLTNEALVEVEFSFSYIAYASSSLTSENNLSTFSDGLKT